uniref:Uncharacterized protein n=1 Tax=Gallus gallus TaxID=9031 RepID=A0A8V0YDM4_CHICK
MSCLQLCGLYVPLSPPSLLQLCTPARPCPTTGGHGGNTRSAPHHWAQRGSWGWEANTYLSSDSLYQSFLLFCVTTVWVCKICSLANEYMRKSDHFLHGINFIKETIF